MKKDGTFITKAQKTKKHLDQLRLQQMEQMVEAGHLKIEGLSQEGEQKPKKVVYSSKKKKKQPNNQKMAQIEAERPATEVKDSIEPAKEEVEIKEGLI